MDTSIEVAVDPHGPMKAVLECFEEIVDDKTDISALLGYVDVERDIWLRIGDVGYVKLSKFNERVIEGHPFIFKSQRKHSKAAIELALRWFDKNAGSSYTSIITNAPDCKRYAVLSAMSAGFKKVGRYEKAFYKDGEYHDMILLQRMRVTDNG